MKTVDRERSSIMEKKSKKFSILLINMRGCAKVKVIDHSVLFCTRIINLIMTSFELVFDKLNILINTSKEMTNINILP